MDSKTCCPTMILIAWTYESKMISKGRWFRISALLVVLAVSSTECNMTSLCSRNQSSMSYLDIAADMITQAKLNTTTRKDRNICLTQRALDCADIIHMGYKKSGVFNIRPVNRVTEDKALDVYCDMEIDGGGWTVIQRRGDFQRKKDYFFEDWKSYKEGFGHVEKDFWLGNDNIFALTNQKLYSVRFDLKDAEQQKRYAFYDKFWIDDEDHKYTLHISGYMGDAGDSMTNPEFDNTQTNNNQKFSTKDQDNDNQKVQHCADLYKGGWWYNACHYSNLNGLYHNGKHNSFADGVIWNTWKGYYNSLVWTEIKIRPKNYRRPSNLRPSDSPSSNVSSSNSTSSNVSSSNSTSSNVSSSNSPSSNVRSSNSTSSNARSSNSTSSNVSSSNSTSWNVSSSNSTSSNVRSPNSTSSDLTSTPV